ncbi:acyl-CoA/acyl-ACP dehydrogenase [Aldersonia sp. NBC_00410]|uniref:acyl-CoA dehydrogenase family protein n=1 Tax=Aldersonia sp. NBC_00410 TaxID=2975954 RepID=UPI00224D2282|nr:acyl-CoA dehydrogenase family protein [Aldersonia sp. NBC_00410]MCX5043271.1 acyl-CoA/acyl-ACP dehydrogenase [Aldersonia sp. NBC_00410]
MDFSREKTCDAVAEVVTALLSREADHHQALLSRESEPDPGAGYSVGTWHRLAENGLLALPLPERFGGDDQGLAEVVTLLGELGRKAVATPALATLGFGVLPLLELADADLQAEILPKVAEGAILTAALAEPSRPLGSAPATTATLDGDTVVIEGKKIGVPYAKEAIAILVPTDAGIALVAPDADGVTLTKAPTSAGTPEYAVELSGVRIPRTRLLTGEPAVLYRYAVACIGATADGLLSGAAELTAEHLRTRHQFGKPLATFQAVAQQIADVYVTSRTLNVSSIAASWRLGTGRDADSDLNVLGYWVAAEAPTALQVCHHLHGGIGVDITYPMHRYFSQGKDLARLVGGAAYRLDLLGAQCSSI